MEYERLSTWTAAQLKESGANILVQLVGGLAHEAGDVPRSLSNAMDLQRAFNYHAMRWPRSQHADRITKGMDLLIKAATNPGTTSEPSWAAPIAAVRPSAEDFVDVQRPASLLGKVMPSASRVPFNVSVPVQTGGGTYRFVGQGAPKPVGNMSLSSVTLPILKASGIIVVTAELLKLSAPASVVVLRREMIRGMSQYLDLQLVDPTVAAVGGVSPASITNGAPSIGSAGTSAANALTDIKKLISDFIAVNPNADSMALLMSPGVATALAVATNSTTLGPSGGSVFGITVHTGNTGSRVVILDPSALLIADDGEMDVTVSLRGSVEMETIASSPVVAGTVLLPLWQLGLAGLKIDRFISYKMARANAVLYTNVAWV